MKAVFGPEASWKRGFGSVDHGVVAFNLWRAPRTVLP